jgi:hypothetical protein
VWSENQTWVSTSCDRPLTAVPVWFPDHAGVPNEACAGFEVKTSDGIWRVASASVTPRGDSVVLTAFTVATASAAVRATRFGYGPWPVNTVVTAGDVPLFPWGERPVEAQ